jgi:peptide/nickel transport system permease protein
VITNDFPGIMGVTFVIGIMYVVVNLVVDLLYAWLDPRIHYA